MSDAGKKRSEVYQPPREEQGQVMSGIVVMVMRTWNGKRRITQLPATQLGCSGAVVLGNWRGRINQSKSTAPGGSFSCFFLLSLAQERSILSSIDISL